MRCAAFVNTTSSNTLLILHSNRIKVFCRLEDVGQIQTTAIFQSRGRLQGNINKKGHRVFLDRGRPQGGINEKDNRSFTKSPPPKMGGGKNRSDSLLQWKQARKKRANVAIDIPKRFKQAKTSIREMNKFKKS